MRQVSEVARLFNVDRDTVKRWCYEFADYLSPAATPPKGQPRYFTESDVRVLAVVFYYWEDEPDYENIRRSLNLEDHNKDVFFDFVYMNTPLFREPPDDIETKNEHSILLNGEFLRNAIGVARAYRTAGDALVEQALSRYYPYELDYPIFFNYRHATELYLKILIGFDPEQDKSHDLARLINDLEAQYGARLPETMRARLEDFHKIDPGSIAFRYAGSMPSGSENELLWIDLYQLKTVMRILCEGFEELLERR